MKNLAVLIIAFLLISVINHLSAQIIQSIFTNPNFEQIAGDY